MTDDELAAVITAYAAIRARANPRPNPVPTPAPSRWALAARLRANPVGRFSSRWVVSGRLRD